MRERWKAVPGFEGLYEVSDQGRVRSLRTRKVLKSFSASLRYPKVNLCVGGKPHQVYVHTLVLLAFVGPRPAGYQARHFPDQTRTNVRLDNLSWGTCKANHADRVVHGTANRGERHGMSKLTKEQVQRILSIEHWPRGAVAALARELGASPVTVGDIKRRRRWIYA